MDRTTLITGLQTQYRAVLDPILPEGTTCAIVDFPNHTNVGDLAIWAGMKKYLRQRSIHIAYQCDTFTYDAKSIRTAIGDTGTIIIHGGGNFGDIWENHELLREQVLRDFPDATIIQFPQSIHFEDTSRSERVRDLIAQAKHFTLLARDEDSGQFATDILHAKTRLCPDSAFMLGAQERQGLPTADIVWLARTDKEAANKPTQAPGVVVLDWLGIPMNPRHLLCYAAARATNILRSLGIRFLATATDRLASSLFDTVAELHIKRGMRLLSRGKVVVTDRLHAHILCLLLDIPHVILDNNYGKLMRFHGTWLNDLPLSTWASTSEEALIIARGLLKEAETV